MSELEKQEVRNKIKALEAKKDSVKGTACEVYTRVTGFIRPVGQFNPGKKAEYGMRKMMKLSPCSCNA